MKKALGLIFMLVVSAFTVWHVSKSYLGGEDALLRESHLEELDIILDGVNEIELLSDYGYRVSPMDDGYTILGKGDSEELVIASKYNSGTVITVGFDLKQFLFLNLTDDKKNFMQNIHEFAGLDNGEKALFDGRHLNIGYQNQYNRDTEPFLYENGEITNIEILEDYDLLVLCADAIENYNFDGKLEEALKKFLSEGKTLMMGTGIGGLGDTSKYKRFMREIGVTIANTARGRVEEVLTDIDKEDMVDIKYINQINKIKNIQDTNSDEEVSSTLMEEISQFYGIKGFGSEEYDELDIKFPYTFKENEPYTRSIIYGRARVNDLSAGQEKDTSVFYDEKVYEPGDLTDVIVCSDNNVDDCNEQVNETIKIESSADRKTVGGVYIVPTGLYLAPGVDATISFNIKDEDMRSQIEHTNLIDFLVSREYGGLSITEATQKRPPGYRKTRKFTLGEYTVSSPVGGAIYLEVLQHIDGLEVEVTIDGAVKMAMYEDGKTSINNFKQQLDDYNVDKVIIISDVNMITTTRPNAEKYLDNGTLVTALAELDEIYENNIDLRLGDGSPGFENTGLYTIPNTDHRVWWQEDVQIKAGWMLSGYPIHTYSSYGLLNEVPKNTGTERRWGEAHELGHNTQFHSVGFDNTVETTVNINALYQEYMREEIFRTYSTKRDDFSGIISYFDAGNRINTWGDKVTVDGKDLGGDINLTFYIQMTLGYYHLNGSKEGRMFDFYKEISRNEIYYDSLDGGWRTRGPELLSRLGLSETVKITTKYEYMYIEASALYNMDVYEMLDRYGATQQISDEVKQVISNKFKSYETIDTPTGELFIHQMTPTDYVGNVPYDYYIN